MHEHVPLPPPTSQLNVVPQALAAINSKVTAKVTAINSKVTAINSKVTTTAKETVKRTVKGLEDWVHNPDSVKCLFANSLISHQRRHTSISIFGYTNVKKKKRSVNTRALSSTHKRQHVHPHQR